MKPTKLFSWTLLGLVVIGFFAAAANVNAIEDWFKLRNYSPPSSIAAVAQQDSLTALGKHLLYINHPLLVNSIANFRTDCPENEQTIVLGCYRPGESGIFAFEVADSRLNGVEQVTIAHEMLHAAYERLSSHDKNTINSELLNYYNHDLHDQRLIDTINSYKQSEPNDLVNEMHSIFGSEVSSLPAPLETYYKRYFSNRQAVVAFASEYQAEFSSRLAQIDANDAKLAKLKVQISAEEQSLAAQSARINSDRTRLESLKSSGQVDTYNSQVDSFNSEVDAYNASLATLKANIASYNSLVNSQNDIINQLRSLNQAIDTRLNQQTAQ